MIEIRANGAPIAGYGNIEMMVLFGFYGVECLRGGYTPEAMTPGTVLTLHVGGQEVAREVVPEEEDDDEGGAQ